MHINNAYKVPDLFIFKELYALEKIHGTSAHLSFNAEKKPHQVHFFSGGATHETFVGLFDKKDLLAKFLELGHSQVTVHGEAYGGKLLRMKETYGPQLRFVAFDVKIGDHWLAVTSAHEIATKLGLEFVHYDRIPATIEAIDAVRDAPSIQAKRNGRMPPRPWTMNSTGWWAPVPRRWRV